MMKKVVVVFLAMVAIISIYSLKYKVYASNPVETIVYGLLSMGDQVKETVEKNQGKTEKADTDKDTIDEVMSGADSFIEQGEKTASIDENELNTTADFLYNLLLAFGIIAAVIVGSILGIKYMLGSVEEKAEYKQTLVGYLISCVVVFGAFGIWKLVINILSSF